ncbi:hypothetical protein Tco_1533029 [Tanacetum coccineum]
MDPQLSPLDHLMSTQIASVAFRVLDPLCFFWLGFSVKCNFLVCFLPYARVNPCSHERWAIPLDKGLFKKIPAVMSSSAVTYTSVYTDSEPWRFYWGSDEEPPDVGSPGVIVYGYDGLPMHPVASPSLDYVPGPEHPSSPNYVPGLEQPPLLVYVLKPEYPEYLVPSDAEVPLEDQPLSDYASPTALSPGYVADSDLEEDPEEDHADYPADGGDGDDEPSDDDDDDDDDDADDEDEEAFEDENDDEEEEHLALVDSSVVPVVDPIPSAGDTEAFDTDESAPTPRSPQIVARLLALPTLPPSPVTPLSSLLPQIPSPPLPVSSPPLPLPSPTVDSPTYAEAPLGYRAVGIRIRAALPPLLLPSTSQGTNIPEAEMPPQKRACFTTSASGFEVEESSIVAAARQPGPTLEADLRRDRVREMGYGITNTWDEIVEAMQEIAPTTLEGVNQRVTKLVTTIRQDTDEFYVRFEDA